MRIVWTGQGELPEAVARQGDEVLRCAASAHALREVFGADRHASASTICLMAFEGGGHCLPAIAYMNRAHPGVPIGLVSRNEDRAAAFTLLRSRSVDRVVPHWEIDPDFSFHLDALSDHGRRLKSLSAALRPFEGATLFMTGATGFLGGHFLRYLLRCSGARVIALTRSTPAVAYNKRLAHLERIHPGRIQYVEGDVRATGLGIATAQREWISDAVEAVWHFAADTRFEAILREELFRANAEGTRNVVHFAQSLRRLKHFHHVSTAYVAGDRRAGCLVPEARLERPPSFKNPYEASKFAAENVVAESGLPATIFRPSIILGERVSGLCDGQTVYKVAQLLRLARLSGRRNRAAEAQTFRVVVDPETTKNLISADEVVYQMLQIAAGEAVPGRYHHLTHPEPTVMSDLIAVMADLLNIPEYEAVSSLEGATLSPSEAVLQRISGVFKPYMLNSDPGFARGRKGDGGVPTMDRASLQYLLQSFFEQHYGWEFQPGAVPV